VVPTFSGTPSVISYRAWRTNSNPSRTASGQFNAFAASGQIVTTMAAKGAILAVATNIEQAAAFAWTNATEDADVDHSDYRFSTAVRVGPAAFSGTIVADAFTEQYVFVTVSVR